MLICTLACMAVNTLAAAQVEILDLPALHQQTDVRAAETGLLVVGIPDAPVEHGVQVGDVVTSAGDIPAPLDFPAFITLATEAHGRGESTLSVRVGGVDGPRQVALGGTKLIPVVKGVTLALCDVPTQPETLQVPIPSARKGEMWYRFLINDAHVGCERHEFVYTADTLIHRIWVAFDLGEDRGGLQLMYCRTELALPDLRLVSSAFHIPAAQWTSALTRSGDAAPYRFEFFEQGVASPPAVVIAAPQHDAYPDYFLAQAPLFLTGTVGGGCIAHAITSDRIGPLASVVAMAEEACVVHGTAQLCVRYDTRSQGRLVRRSWRTKDGHMVKHDYGNGAWSENTDEIGAIAGLGQPIIDFVNEYGKAALP